MTKEMTIAEYAAKVNVSKHAIEYRIKNNLFLPGVAETKQTVNKIWILVVGKIPAEIELQKYFSKKRKINLVSTK